MHCNATDCGHEATISTDRFPADLPFLDIALRVRCSACGAKPVGVVRDMLGVYARLHAKYSWGMRVRPATGELSRRRVGRAVAG
ncbi:hypothetical protein M446_4727 [Methylobacterium sp. 4-46]|uniref:hypothetical protein n=1 Tax=unclassified Methylobacterium TaxID=2615210 RepID=UPI000165CC4D|nr:MULTISPECIES: hypothetical protein [Methylobacterium]ACA19059.1 hypothetical protein M446_4727 [Methylobacterium sp. 4-46]WFT78271.1 hypothetical protein QA634_23755 [Methylobacterium nodulans]